MKPRSIASVPLIPIALLAAVFATGPLGAAAESSSVRSITVGDVAQMILSEQASVEADIGLLQIHIQALEADRSVAQFEVSDTRDRVGAYRDSAEVQLLKNDIDGYNVSCVGHVLIGNQNFSCGIAREKLRKRSNIHDAKMNDFLERLDMQNKQLRRVGVELRFARNKVQNLQAYAYWLASVREKTAKACGDPSTSAGSRTRQCDQVPFDRARIDLPPCEGERCPAWARP